MKKYTLFLLPLLLINSCGSTKTIDDVTRYNELLTAATKLTDFHTELYIFPKDISGGTSLEFTYKTSEGLFSGSYLFYLVMSYNQEAFNAEINRLSKIEAVFKNGTIKKIIHFDEQSIYLTINKDNRYEYAKYDSDKLTIAYVSNQLYEWSDTNVKKEYSLSSVVISNHLDDGNNSYNMYYRYEIEDGLTTGYYINE